MLLITIQYGGIPKLFYSQSVPGSGEVKHSILIHQVHFVGKGSFQRNASLISYCHSKLLVKSRHLQDLKSPVRRQTLFITVQLTLSESLQLNQKVEGCLWVAHYTSVLCFTLYCSAVYLFLSAFQRRCPSVRLSEEEKGSAKLYQTISVHHTVVWSEKWVCFVFFKLFCSPLTSSCFLFSL